MADEKRLSPTAEEKAYGSSTGESPPYEGQRHNSQVEAIVQEKGMRMGEAADMYGDVATAEEYGYVARGLKSRHIQFIALGGTIGTGLFLGIGKALGNSGPAPLLMGYTMTGMFVYALMQCLGEMATWLPLPGAIPQFCSRYVDGALGFAVGWNNWYQNAITICAEISAASVVINYWEGAQHINVAAWITIILVLIICLNIFAIQIYGEAEFIFASLKLITIFGLLIMAFIFICGGNPAHYAYGFYYWQPHLDQTPPLYGAFIPYPGVSTVATSQFLAFFSTLVNAAFSYGGVELVAVAAGEAENPRKNIPKAVRRVFWRILFFYVLGSLAIGCLVPANTPGLLKNSGSAASPWVIAIKNAGVPALDSIVNFVILTSASSSGNAFLYTGSRYLYALAQNGQAPRIFLKCSARGVPYYAVCMTAAVGLLTYLSCDTSGGGAAQAFGWFQNIVTIAQLFTWVSIGICYVKFYNALRAQGIDRNTLVFKSPFQPYLAYGVIVFFSIVIIFNGFSVFIGLPGKDFDYQSFITDYIGLPIFFGFYFIWKVIKRTRIIPAAEVDLFTGKAALDAADAHWPEQIPRNFIEKFWFWLC